jgi:hypothetical protein
MQTAGTYWLGRFHHHQRETHHDASQGNQPADAMGAVLLGLADGVYGLFLSHDSPGSGKHAAAAWRSHLSAQRAFLGRAGRIVQWMNIHARSRLAGV